MNIIKLQDILKGVPDNRLQKELQNPTGEIPSYLVLSEVVRRDRLRQGMASAPSQSSVLEDAMAKAQSAPMPQQMQQAPEGQQPPAGYADGGFISPNNAMAQSGVRGFNDIQKPPQQQIQLGPSSPSMFAPNMNPKPAPMVNAPVNVSNQGYQPDAYQPDGYENNNFTQSAMARGGIVALADGDMARSYPTKAELIAYIREAAIKRGMDPDIALKVAYSEGLNARPEEGYQSFIKDDQGNREESYGIFQLNMKPGAVGDQMLKQTGIHPKQDVRKSIDFALDTANRVGWGPWMGAAAVGVTGKMGTAGGPAGDVVEPAADVAVAEDAIRDGGWASASAKPSEDESWLSSLGDMLGGDAVKMGKILMNKKEEKMIPLLDLSTRGDPKAAASTRTRSPEEILRAYQSLRSSYMADGGSVQRMAGGPPGGGAVAATVEPFQELTSAQILALPPDQQAEYLRKLREFRAKESREAGGWGVVVGPQGRAAHLTEGAAKANADAARAKEEADRVYREKILRGETFLYQPSEETILEASRGLEGLPPLNAPVEVEEVVTAPSEAETAAPEGVEAPKEKGVYDLLREMQTQSIAAEQAYYDEMLRMEEEKAKQSGGLGAFLRQMGLGMMANPGTLQQQLTGGLYAAGTSREEAQAAMADKINEIKLARKKADIENIKDRIQLQIDELTAGQLDPKDKATLAVRALEAKLKDETDPEVRKLIMEEIDSVLRDIGVNIPTFLPTDEDGTQDATGIWDTIFGSSDR